MLKKVLAHSLQVWNLEDISQFDQCDRLIWICSSNFYHFKDL